MTSSLVQTLGACLTAGTPAATVVVAATWGSTPREAGAAMLVTSDRVDGTIGGGRFEWDAIAEARSLLTSQESRREITVPLGPSIGQCCGGKVTLVIERASLPILDRLRAAEAAEHAACPDVLIFGAGFVGRALATALAPLPFKVRLIDGRAQEFIGFEVAGVTNVVTDRMTAAVDAAPANAAYLVMTHSHSLDALVAATVLERADFRYLGIIGSRTKRKRFTAAFRQQGILSSEIARIHCPIGGTLVRDKRPVVIAALAAAELITIFTADPASVARSPERPSASIDTASALSRRENSLGARSHSEQFGAIAPRIDVSIAK